jgi:hypothetical protein
LAETGSDVRCAGRTKVRLGKTEEVCGDAECAVTQTVHFAASVALEWWCVTNPTAEHKVSSRQNNAIRFENDRIRTSATIPLKIYTEEAAEYNRLL